MKLTRDQILTTNSKLVKNSIPTKAFGISAGLTCPSAGICRASCYMGNGPASWPVSKEAYNRRFKFTQTYNFVPDMIAAIIESKSSLIRIHDSGDFYSQKYFSDWLGIIMALPHVEFYCYTKEILKFKNTHLPDNLTVIFSYGGRYDHLINPRRDRHSHIFKDRESLEAAGYVYTNDHDDAALGPNHKIGLVYHGPKSKEFTTWRVSNESL